MQRMFQLLVLALCRFDGATAAWNRRGLSRTGNNTAWAMPGGSWNLKSAQKFSAQCQKGIVGPKITKGQACCARSCGQCNTRSFKCNEPGSTAATCHKCHTLPGGSALCCPMKILHSGRLCKDGSDVGCVLGALHVPFEANMLSTQPRKILTGAVGVPVLNLFSSMKMGHELQSSQLLDLPLALLSKGAVPQPYIAERTNRSRHSWPSRATVGYPADHVLFLYNPDIIGWGSDFVGVRLSTYSYCSLDAAEQYISRQKNRNEHLKQALNSTDCHAYFAVVKRDGGIKAIIRGNASAGGVEDGRMFWPSSGQMPGWLYVIVVRKVPFADSTVWLTRLLSNGQQTSVRLRYNSSTFGAEKNWVPLLHKDGAAIKPASGADRAMAVLLVQSFCPLIILRCNVISGECVMAHEMRSLLACSRQLRGGSSFVKMAGGDFLGIAHRNLVTACLGIDCEKVNRVYDHFWVRLRGKPPHDVIAISGPFRFPAYFNSPLDHIQFCSSLRLHDDQVQLGYGVGDCQAVTTSIPLQEVMETNWLFEVNARNEYFKLPLEVVQSKGASCLPQRVPSTTSTTATMVVNSFVGMESMLNQSMEGIIKSKPARGGNGDKGANGGGKGTKGDKGGKGRKAGVRVKNQSSKRKSRAAAVPYKAPIKLVTEEKAHPQERAGLWELMGCGVLWFLHVPKTGGSTVQKQIREAAFSNSGQPEPWSFVDLQRGKWDDQFNATEWQLPDQWQSIAKPELEKERPRLIVHHHHGVPSLAKLLPNFLQPLACQLKAKRTLGGYTTLDRTAGCGWSGVDRDGQKSFDGGVHSVRACLDLCTKDTKCQYAAVSPSVHQHMYCHTFRTCDGKMGGNWTVYQKQQGCRLVIATVLREPRSIAKSHAIYKHSLQTQRTSQWFQSKTINFSFLSHVNSHKNLQAKYLMYGHESGWAGNHSLDTESMSDHILQATLELLSHVELVGVTERLHQFVECIFDMLGWFSPGDRHINKSPTDDKIYSEAHAEGNIALIDEAMQIDNRLYKVALDRAV